MKLQLNRNKDLKKLAWSCIQVPYATLHHSHNSTIPTHLRQIHGKIEHLRLVNSYGLFRRMTGMGGRPEVIIEGGDNIDGPWKEYEFLYKPGNVNNSLPFVGESLQNCFISNLYFSIPNRHLHSCHYYHFDLKLNVCSMLNLKIYSLTRAYDTHACTSVILYAML